jgi:hypothetical protein
MIEVRISEVLLYLDADTKRLFINKGYPALGAEGEAGEAR